MIEIFKTNTDKNGVVVRKKGCLVAQEYTRIEGIDFNGIFVLVTSVELIHIQLYLLLK